MCEIFCQSVQKKQEEKRIEEDQAAKAQSWKFPVCYDDEDDEESSNSLKDNIISELPPYSAVTPTEPIDSLSMEDEHLDTIPATESDEVIKSCVKNLESSNSLNDNIYQLPPYSVITPDEPVLSTEEPVDSLIKGDEHLDTILATESDEFIKSGVESLIPIPSESEDQFEDFSESNEEFSSIDDDSFSFNKIDYVEASPPDSELVSSEVMEIEQVT
nr:hypothetical protein [Tanacetum cinerariifolium]